MLMMEQRQKGTLDVLKIAGVGWVYVMIGKRRRVAQWSFPMMEAAEAVYVVLYTTARDCLRRLHLSLFRFVGVDWAVVVERDG